MGGSVPRALWSLAPAWGWKAAPPAGHRAWGSLVGEEGKAGAQGQQGRKKWSEEANLGFVPS